MQVSRRVLPLQPLARRIRGKAPGYRGASAVTIALPRADLLPDRCCAREAAVEALAAEHGEFDLGHVQPASVLRRMAELELAQDPPGLFSRKGVIERPWRVGAQVVEHDADLLRLRV